MFDKDEPTKPTETEQFARMLNELLCSSIAQNQQITTIDQPDPKPDRLDTSPVVLNVRLDSRNYPLWAVLMKAAINGKGLISHITGIPSPPARTDQAFARWQQPDHCVFTWILHNLDQKLVNRVSQYPTTRDVWASLETTYASSTDKIQVYDLYTQATNVRQRDESLEDIWTTLQEIWVSIDQRKPNPMKDAESIRTYNIEMQELRLFQFLTALNDKHESIKKELLRADPLPSVEEAYAVLR